MFPIYLTGIRNYEEVIAKPGSKSNEDSKLIFRSNKSDYAYPPSKDALNSLSEKEWSKLLLSLSQLPYFKDKTSADITASLYDNSTDDKNLYLDDVEDLFVKSVNLSGPLFDDKMSEEDRTKFSKDNEDDPLNEGFWPLKSIYAAIQPNKPGSRAKHHTLIFRPSIWMIQVDTKSKVVSRSLVFDLETAEYVEVKKEIIYIDGVDVAVIANKTNDLSLTALYNIISELLDIKIKKLEQMAALLTSWSTPAVYKSLIQKIIRTGAPTIIHDNISYPANAFLLVAYSLLLLHPGSYNPQIHSFVSGQESAMKRLAISICEDSYLVNKELEKQDLFSDNKEPGGAALASLLLAALVTKNNRNSWWPSLKLVTIHMKLALIAHSCPYQYKYSTKSYKAITGDGPYSIVLSSLELLKSFATDINMVSWICHNKGEKRDIENYNSLPGITTMPLVHCLDQHVYPEVVYYLDWDFVVNYGSENDFGDFFIDVWKLCSSANFRSGTGDDYEESELVIEFRKAQKRLYRVKTAAILTPNVKFYDEPTIVRFTLSDDYLAGLIGPIDIKIRKNKFKVSLDPLDIASRKVVKIVKKDEDIEISDKERAECIFQFNALLEEGVKPLKLAILGIYKISTIILKDEEFYVEINKKEVLWSRAKNYRLEVPVFKAIVPEDPLVECINMIKIDGMEKGALDYSNNNDDANETNTSNATSGLSSLLSEYSAKTLQRLLTVLLISPNNIELPNIDRLGKGTQYSVKIIDVQVFQLLCRLVFMFPFVILRNTKNSQRFIVKYPPFIDIIKSKLQQTSINAIKSFRAWPTSINIKDKQERELMQHQDEIINSMLDSNQHTHLIDSPKGTGKTMIVCEYLRLLNERKRLPPYIIYTLPPSAVGGVKKELKYYGFEVNIIDPRDKNYFEFKKHCINLIFLDHLKRPDVLSGVYAIISRVFLIVDEFHYTLNPTIRTTTILELSRSCYKCVAMSGTPITNTNVELIIPWLSQIVNFEVVKSNIWVALGAMLSKRVDIGIKIKRKNVEVEMEDGEIETKYLELVKNKYTKEKLGISPTDFTAAIKLCYLTCMNEMIELTMQYINDGIMLVARNSSDQYLMYKKLMEKGLNVDEVFLLDSKHPINLLANDPRPIKVVIVTIYHNTGYPLTKLSRMITSVYFTNQAVREQLEGRIARIGQPKTTVYVMTIHTGLLTDILKRYEEAKNMSLALKSLAEEIGISGSFVSSAMKG